MTYGKLSKICATISLLPMAYQFLVLGEITDFAWTVFFVFLGFAVLFDRLNKKDDEIEMLRSDKKPEPTEQSKDQRSFDPFHLPDSKSKQELLKKITKQNYNPSQNETRK